MASFRLMKNEDEGVFSQVVNDDILLKILDKLPAVSFASAACVDKRWNQNCNRILSRPKLSSAMSLNPDLHAALDEVLGEAFSKPLRPSFLITYIGVNFNLEEAHGIITNKVGPGVPVIISTADGLIGREVERYRSREVIWGSSDDNSNRGIVLSVGYVPGLKVDVIPLLRPNTDFGMTGRYFSGPETQTKLSMVDHFLLEIMDYTYSVSRSTAPSCIMIFGDQNDDMNQLLAILDRAMPRETAIVGDSSASFLCTRIDETQNKMSRDLFSFSAAALVFARDQNKPQDIGETEFHVTMSPGIIPFGTHLTAVSVLEKRCLSSWSSTIIVGLEGAIIDCYCILKELNSKLGKPDIYIGVTQARKYSILGKGPSSMDSLSYHEVKGGEMDFIVVGGTGIRPGDSFLLYYSDLENASVAIDQACENLQTLVNDHAKNRREVFGGFIFSSRNRGAGFFNRPAVDSKPFAMNFPGVPVAGMFGNGQIARGALLGVKEEEEQLCPSSSVHAHSSVYLAMSYVPPKPQH